MNHANEPIYPEQLPPEAERALGEGHLRAAAEIARGVHRASRAAGAKQPTRGEERARLERDLFKHEETALTKWAEQNGLMLDSAEFWCKHKAANDYAAQLGGDSIDGMEHSVYPDGWFWFKANSAEMQRTWLRYFHRLALHQVLFPETGLEFLGFIKSETGKLYSVTRQPHVHALRGATQNEVETEMKLRGYVRISDMPDHPDYYNPTAGIMIDDLHDQNVVVLETGELVVIDPIPSLPVAEDFLPATMTNPITGKPVGGGRLQRFNPAP
jgi:hypothetical protein